jgi:hypothetical protein
LYITAEKKEANEMAKGGRQQGAKEPIRSQFMKLINCKFVIFVIITLIVALIIIPICFNYLFMWHSGLSKGETSDWFVFYGNIFGGLIGGFFTYLSLLLTFKKEKKDKFEEKRPRIDIPHQNFEFTDSGEIKDYFTPIVIELNNIGGSVAKNIECKLSLPNFEEVLNALQISKDRLKIDLIKESTKDFDIIEHNIYTTGNDGIRSAFIRLKDDKGDFITSLGQVHKEFNSVFVGSCIPMVLNHEAKTKYFLQSNVRNWINYIVRKRNYTNCNKSELFDLDLEVKYSSIEFGDFTDYFKLKWEIIGIKAEGSTKFQYVLKSTKVG